MGAAIGGTLTFTRSPTPRLIAIGVCGEVVACSSQLRRGSTAEITGALKSMTRVLDGAQIWVNPDCGLKTRGWEETLAALKNMVAAAREMRNGSR